MTLWQLLACKGENSKEAGGAIAAGLFIGTVLVVGICYGEVALHHLVHPIAERTANLILGN